MSTALDPLSERGTRIVDSLSTYEQDDPSAIAVMRASADELDAIEDLMEAVRYQAWPHQADDTYGILALHERQLNLPVEPPGVPLDQRQATVKAAMQGRRSGRKADWRRRMNTAMRGQPWTYEENTPAGNMNTITVPWAEDAYNSVQVKRLARRITPAHVEIVMAYSGGFLVGISPVGDAL